MSWDSDRRLNCCLQSQAYDDNSLSQASRHVASLKADLGGTEILRELDWLKRFFGPEFDPTQYRMLLFGLAMVVLMIWRPRGLIGFRQPSIFLRERRSVRADMVKEGHG